MIKLASLVVADVDYVRYLLIIETLTTKDSSFMTMAIIYATTLQDCILSHVWSDNCGNNHSYFPWLQQEQDD